MRKAPRPRSLLTTFLTAALGAVLALTIATPGVAGAAAGFGDVPEDEYYTDAVAWLVGEQITTGTEPGCFGPDLNVTRGQVAAFLHRLDDTLGNDPRSISAPFTDVTADYQQEPVGWLYGAGLTTGVSPTRFAPRQPITRGNFAVLIWRYAGSPSPTDALPFTDVTKSYQRDAIAWMAEEGITTGTSTTTFSPNSLVTRAQSAAFLFRFVSPEGVITAVESNDCIRSLRVALEAGGLTDAEARCAAPYLTDFGVDYLLDVISGRADADIDLIIAAVTIGDRCLTGARIADLSRLFL